MTETLLRHRWANFTRALGALERFMAAPEPSEMSRTAAIKAFEVTLETGWKLLRAYTEAQGGTTVFQGSKSVVRDALQLGLLSPEAVAVWLEMIEVRNKTAHTYDPAVVEAVYTALEARFVEEFKALRDHLAALVPDDTDSPNT